MGFKSGLAVTHWEHFEHDADIGVRGVGDTKSAAFEQAAKALLNVIAEPTAIRPVTSVEIECSAPDDAILLADWLNALVFEIATRRVLLAEFKVELYDDSSLRAVARGEPFDPERHAPSTEVKGATYTELSVDQQRDGTWIAQCIVDV